MTIRTPEGGTQYIDIPANIGAQQVDNIQRWIRQYSQQYNVPEQFLLNMAMQESQFNAGLVGPPVASHGGDRAQGMMQFMPRTAAERRRSWGWADFDPFNPEHAIHGAAREASEIYARLYGDTPGRRPGYSWEPVAAGYNWGDRRERLRNWGPESQEWLRNNNPETSDYWQAVTRGLPPPTFTGGIGSDFPLSPAESSRAAGYELPAGVEDFLNMTVPELGGGPGSFDPNSPFPWHTPGRISEDVGAVLQHHALMPNNLQYNRDTAIWDVPNERRFPGATGVWGAQSVANWLPDAPAGFGRDYLTHLGYGAPPQSAYDYGHGATNWSLAGGLDPRVTGSNMFGVGNWFNQFSGNQGFDWLHGGLVGSPGVNVWDAPNVGGNVDVWDATGGRGTTVWGAPNNDLTDEQLANTDFYIQYDPGIVALGNSINQQAQQQINQGYQTANYNNQLGWQFTQQNQAGGGINPVGTPVGWYNV